MWKSDGTNIGTGIVNGINVGSNDFNPQYLTNVNGTLYFTADDGVHGTELWKSDGTKTSTVLQDLNVGPNGSNPVALTNINGNLYFAANDGVHGEELWVVE